MLRAHHVDGLEVNWLKFWPPPVGACPWGRAVDVPAVPG